jgi:hypothetical protein
MNILHLISSGGMYGAEAVILNLCCQLRAQGHGAEIAVFNNEHAPNLALADAARARNFRVHLIPCRGKFDPSATGKIRERLLLSNVDVLHTHGYKADLYGYLGASKVQAAKVSTCHNWCENDIYESLYGFADRYVLRIFDQVTAVSKLVEQCVNRAGV